MSFFIWCFKPNYNLFQFSLSFDDLHSFINNIKNVVHSRIQWKLLTFNQTFIQEHFALRKHKFACIFDKLGFTNTLCLTRAELYRFC
jgi:hypothetical protein